MEIRIEKAQESDKPRIFQLLEQVNMHYIPSEEMPELTFDNYAVAKIDDTVVGFCGYKVLNKTTAKTELMAVDPTYRGHGIGYTLQKWRMEQIYRRGITTLITNTDLPPTIAWYKKHFGYKQTGTLEKVHEFGDPSIDHWTTLQTDLTQWFTKEKLKENS